VLYFVFLIFSLGNKFNLIHGIPAILILCFIAIPCSLLLGILGARFRDISNIVSSSLTLLFFITPVLWKPGMALNLDSYYLRFNPFYYAIQVPRSAILDGDYFPQDIMILVYIFIFLLICSSIIFHKYKKMLGFWI
jgi:ABC-type polysaccharide/polyol phosphate export permease